MYTHVCKLVYQIEYRKIMRKKKRHWRGVCKTRMPRGLGWVVLRVNVAISVTSHLGSMRYSISEIIVTRLGYKPQTPYSTSQELDHNTTEPPHSIPWALKGSLKYLLYTITCSDNVAQETANVVLCTHTCIKVLIIKLETWMMMYIILYRTNCRNPCYNIYASTCTWRLNSGTMYSVDSLNDFVNSVNILF